MPNDIIYSLTSGKVDAYLIEEVSFGVQNANHPELDCLEEPTTTYQQKDLVDDKEGFSHQIEMNFKWQEEQK